VHAALSNLTLVATTVLAVMAALILVIALVAAPLVHGDGGPPSVTDRDTLVIGVRDTPPGLAHRVGDGSLEGFYIDVSSYIAGRLGVTSSSLTFRALAPDEWETALSRGTVDMVVAAYTHHHARPPRTRHVRWAVLRSRIRTSSSGRGTSPCGASRICAAKALPGLRV
jgi:glutamate transport system substrate-binding protein